MDRKMMKVFIWLIVICTLIGTGVASEYGSSIPTTGYPGSSGSMSSSTSIQSSTQVSMGSSGMGTISKIPFFPGGYSCYNNPQCGSQVCTPVCTQQCTPQPPCCKDVCTEQCTCTPVCTQQCTPQPPICQQVCTQCPPAVSTGGCMYGGCTNWGAGGSYCSDCCDYCGRYSSWNRYSFFANETEIEDVSGEWETNLFGSFYMKLTGDDILRGMYEVEGLKGYMQGDFTGNSTPNVVGIWWQEPTFQPFNNAGGFSITFDFEDATMEGVYAYSDGTWAPFTGTKVNAQLSEEMDETLYDMPEYKAEISEELMSKVIDAPNPIDTNPLNNAAAVEE